jgi:hypothetical protein
MQSARFSLCENPSHTAPPKTSRAFRNLAASRCAFASLSTGEMRPSADRGHGAQEGKAFVEHQYWPSTMVCKLAASEGDSAPMATASERDDGVRRELLPGVGVRVGATTDTTWRGPYELMKAPPARDCPPSLLSARAGIEWQATITPAAADRIQFMAKPLSKRASYYCWKPRNSYPHHGRGVAGQRVTPQWNGTASRSAISTAPTSFPRSRRTAQRRPKLQAGVSSLPVGRAHGTNCSSSPPAVTSWRKRWVAVRGDSAQPSMRHGSSQGR